MMKAVNPPFEVFFNTLGLSFFLEVLNLVRTKAANHSPFFHPSFSASGPSIYLTSSLLVKWFLGEWYKHV
jgi:hypothetical protein